MDCRVDRERERERETLVFPKTKIFEVCRKILARQFLDLYYVPGSLDNRLFATPVSGLRYWAFYSY